MRIGIVRAEFSLAFFATQLGRISSARSLPVRWGDSGVG